MWQERDNCHAGLLVAYLSLVFQHPHRAQQVTLLDAPERGSPRLPHRCCLARRCNLRAVGGAEVHGVRPRRYLPAPIASTMATTKKKAPTRSPKTNHPKGLITGAELAIGLTEARTKKTKKQKKKNRTAGSYVVRLDYATGIGNRTARKLIKVKDPVFFNTVVLMLRTGPAYYHEGENAISIASSQPTSGPGGTRSAKTTFVLPA